MTVFPQDVTATIRYLTPTDQRPVYYASQAGADAQFDIDVGFEERSVTIHDARVRQPAPTLDREGFMLLDHASGIDDFYQLSAQQERYEAELVAMVCQATGAQAASVFDHTLRSDSPIVRGARSIREPASFIHNDYTDASAVKRLFDILPEDEAERRRQSRFAIVNVWRAIAEPVWNSPIACCDASSLQAGDLVPTERRARDRIGELEMVSWNASHQWYYYPRMHRGEVLLIKTFDSVRDGRATRCIHTAFNNPLAPAEAPPRESMESRLLVFFISP